MQKRPNWTEPKQTEDAALCTLLFLCIQYLCWRQWWRVSEVFCAGLKKQEKLYCHLYLHTDLQCNTNNWNKPCQVTLSANVKHHYDLLMCNNELKYGNLILSLCEHNSHCTLAASLGILPTAIYNIMKRFRESGKSEWRRHHCNKNNKITL